MYVLSFDTILLQGVPYHWAHFVFAIFSASGARTEELFIAIGQPTKFQFRNSPYFPSYVNVTAQNVRQTGF